LLRRKDVRKSQKFAKPTEEDAEGCVVGGVEHVPNNQEKRSRLPTSKTVGE
jgi:hypothetical protein